MVTSSKPRASTFSYSWKTQLAALDGGKKEERKKITALQKDKIALEARMTDTDTLLISIGGQLTEADAKLLILKKLYDLSVRPRTRALSKCRAADSG